MTENQFIVELQNALKRLPEEELNDIILDIREYFTNGREDGKSDSEIAASLGSPQIIAEELQASYSFPENEVEVTPINKVITITILPISISMLNMGQLWLVRPTVRLPPLN